MLSREALLILRRYKTACSGAGSFKDKAVSRLDMTSMDIPFEAIELFVFRSTLLVIFVVGAVRMIREHLRR
jgi:hypothetical protein